MRSQTRRAALAARMLLALSVLVMTGWHAAAAEASSGINWGSVETAKIRPGVTVEMGGVQCQAGFVLTDGKRVFLTTTGGCASIWPGEDVNGCATSRDSAGVDPPRTEVTIQGARHLGWLAYHSFARMKLTGEKHGNRCHYNSLALIRVDPRDVKRTNPTIPVVGGPERVATAATAAPSSLVAFLPGMTNAQAIDTTNGGWAHTAMVDGHVAATNAGAPVLTPGGAALGMVTVVPPQGTVGETTVADLGRQLKQLRQVDRFSHVHLARGTKPYSGPGLPLLG
jgi:prepilin-type processing-associated H-X9-DG protein